MASDEPGKDKTGERSLPSRQSRRYWMLPIQFGAGFAALQLVIFILRFGFADSPALGREWLIAVIGLGSGLVLFFIGGALAGLFVQRVLRDATGVWRKCLMAGIALATPLAAFLSLAGGLLGPHMVVVYALVPYLLLAGIPAVIRAIWLRLGKPAGGHST